MPVGSHVSQIRLLFPRHVLHGAAHWKFKRKFLISSIKKPSLVKDFKLIGGVIVFIGGLTTFVILNR